MENQSTPTKQLALPPPASDSDSDSDSDVHTVSTTNQVTAHHSSPPHSDHISISPPPGNSPDHSSASSDRTSISHRSSPGNEKPQSPENRDTPPHPTAVVYRNVSQEPVAIVNKVSLEEPVAVVSKTDTRGRGVDYGGGHARQKFSPSLSILRRGKREKIVKRAALGFRILGFLFCLVSLSVMAADRNQGWALDSFHRYIEFRYCVSVNVIGFLYSGAQALDLSYTLATGKYIFQLRQARCYFDFTVDQMVAYLLISASSSAATRIDDWQSNWGKDKFPDMATASVAMSFLAFVALAASSLVSGYALCTSKFL